MELLKSACYFVGVLSVLIIAHEWGHFFVAKLCKMRVDDFSLFFGPRLIRLGERNGTEYNIRSIPLGGFVKIAGMEPEETASLGRPIYERVEVDAGVVSWEKYQKTLVGLNGGSFDNIKFENISERTIQAVSAAIGDDARLTTEGREYLKSLQLTTGINKDEDLYLQAILAAGDMRPDPDWYSQKPLWQRAAVIFAGPFMSLLFGYGLFCVMGFTTGLPDMDNRHMAVGPVEDGRPAAKAGLKPGDWIMAVNGKPTDADEAYKAMRSSVDLTGTPKPLPITFTLKRDQKTFDVTLTPYLEKGNKIDDRGHTVKGKDGKPEIGYVSMIGIHVDSVWTRYGVMESVVRGTAIIKDDITSTFKSIFSKDVRNNVGGIITIGSVISENSKQGPNHVFFTAAMLSVSLGILNLFPIPVLDGGHLMILAWEGLRRRRLTSREVYGAQMVGLCIIGVLFVLVMYNDIARLFRKQ